MKLPNLSRSGNPDCAVRVLLEALYPRFDRHFKWLPLTSYNLAPVSPVNTVALVLYRTSFEAAPRKNKSPGLKQMQENSTVFSFIRYMHFFFC
jgi:hypothetical protein